MLFDLGHCHQHGIRVEKDENKAFIYYKRSALLGSADGLFYLGYCYQHGIGVEKDENIASIHYNDSAYRYQYEDQNKAFNCYIISAELGNAFGLFNLAYCYQHGIGTEKDENIASIYYKKSAYFYQHGIGVKDEKKAFTCYQKSAELGNADGLFHLGYCYQHGIGIGKDKNKAFIYYQRSAKLENTDGLLNLGHCYQHEIGVKKDEKKAFIYYQKSAELGNAEGLFNLGYCYQHGIGVQKDENDAFKYYKKSAELGNAEGLLNLGHCYQHGVGIEKDVNMAFIYYIKSAEQENNKGLCEINNLPLIDYNEFKDVEEIGKGGFSTVYKARWKNQNRWLYVALKLIHNQEYIHEIKAYCEINFKNASFIKFYGLSRNKDTDNYFLVLEYANNGSLRNNLNIITKMRWEEKLEILNSMVFNLEVIHSNGFIHRDLHSGNILQDNLHNAYIADLGLTISANKMQGGIYGVMPYVAPEVLNGDPFTQASDIYSFGVIMTEITTGKGPFDGETFDIELSIRICQGERPKCALGTPNHYIKLAERCMDHDFRKRPTANEIKNEIEDWLQQIEGLNESEIKKQFLESDMNKPEPIEQNHSQQMYPSIFINTQELVSKIIELKI